MKVTLNTVDAEENVPLDTMGKCPEADTISPNVRSSLDPYLEDKIPSLYYIEILSDCNLKCPLCAFSHKEIFERKHGKMDFELFCKILDKIKLESPNATIFPYHFCEPSLHPLLPEMIKAIKDRGFSSSASFNFSTISRLDDLLQAGIDSLTISVSGFFQSTYSKGHAGGNIEKVKENLIALREAMDRLALSPHVMICYHMYRDNLGIDFDEMRKFTQELGFIFGPVWARSICNELTLKWLRENGLNTYQGETCAWFDALPPLKECFNSCMKERMLYTPHDFSKNMSSQGLQAPSECLFNNRIIHIKWSGKINLCAFTFDDRLISNDYLATSLEESYKAKKENLICKECLSNNMAWYWNYLDIDTINAVARANCGYELPADRSM